MMFSELLKAQAKESRDELLRDFLSRLLALAVLVGLVACHQTSAALRLLAFALLLPSLWLLGGAFLLWRKAAKAQA